MGDRPHDRLKDSLNSTAHSFRATFKFFLPLLLIGGTALAAGWRLSSAPALWWDEGWTLSVARNWVELGHYGRLFGGEPVNPSMAANFPVVAPIALGFRLFGVGIWQGRLAGVVFLIGALATIYVLALQLYNRKVAVVALVLLGFLFPLPGISPVFMARQALGELPMIFFLLAGYALFAMALRQPRWLPPAAVCWAIGLAAKQQPLPFWVASMVVPMIVAGMRRQGHTVGALAIGLGAGLGLQQLIRLWTRSVLSGYQLPGGPVEGLERVTALVFSSQAQLAALHAMLVCSPLLLGVAYAAYKWLRPESALQDGEPRRVVQLQLLVLAGSWCGWFATASVGWPRYLFPVAFIGCLFTGVLLHDLTLGFDLRSLRGRLGALLRAPQFSRQNLRVITAVLFMAVLVALGARTARVLYGVLAEDRNIPLVRVVEFLNTSTPAGARIETYESELFLWLNRPYSYPPDQIHVGLVERMFVNRRAVPVSYSPLEADPDYLVIGDFARWYEAYEPFLTTGAFRLVYKVQQYEVYERVR